VPSIDDIDHQRELDLLLLGELGLQGSRRSRAYLLRRAASVPRSSRAPRVRGRYSLAPGRQQVDPLLGLALRARFLRVHIEAVGAAVDLGGTDFHEPDEGRFKARSDGEGWGVHFFMSSGAAAKRSLTVMYRFLLFSSTP